MIRSTTEDAILETVQEDQMAVKILPHIRLINSNEATWFILNKAERVGVVFEKLTKKRGLRVTLNPDKFVLLAVADQEGQQRSDQKTEMMSDLFGGYNPYG